MTDYPYSILSCLSSCFVNQHFDFTLAWYQMTTWISKYESGASMEEDSRVSQEEQVEHWVVLAEVDQCPAEHPAAHGEEGEPSCDQNHIAKERSTGALRHLEEKESRISSQLSDRHQDQHCTTVYREVWICTGLKWTYLRNYCPDKPPGQHDCYEDSQVVVHQMKVLSRQTKFFVFWMHSKKTLTLTQHTAKQTFCFGFFFLNFKKASSML